MTAGQALARSRDALEAQVHELEAKLERAERRGVELASALLASMNLHELLDFDRLVVLLKDTVINLIGSERFGLYLSAGEGDALSLFAHEGLDHDPPSISRSDATLERALAERRAIVATEEELRAGAPLACVPLVAAELELGAIVLHGLLAHKRALDEGDRELLDLLARHAGTALLASKMGADRASVEAARRGLEVAAMASASRR